MHFSWIHLINSLKKNHLTWDNTFYSKLFEINRKPHSITVSEYEQLVCNPVKYLSLDCDRNPANFFVPCSFVMLHTLESKKNSNRFTQVWKIAQVTFRALSLSCLKWNKKISDPGNFWISTLTKPQKRIERASYSGNHLR